MTTNAKCAICGRDYQKCVSCADEKKLKPWKAVTDTIDHYKIYLAIHGYTVTKNKDIAFAELLSCDLSELESFNPEIKNSIKEIMGDTKKAKQAAPIKQKKQTDTEKTVQDESGNSIQDESGSCKNDYE